MDRALQQLSGKNAKIEELMQDSQKQRKEYTLMTQNYNSMLTCGSGKLAAGLVNLANITVFLLFQGCNKGRKVLKRQ